MKSKIQVHAALIFAVITIVLSQKEEDKGYEFGFTIDGQQHRHEKKDEKGIIEGEFGFITADGIYHVTVYATDENGNFKILSMKNVRISAPLDGSPLTGPISPDAEKYLKKLPPGQRPQQAHPQPLSIDVPEPPVVPPVVYTTTRVPFTTQSTIKPACAGCGYVTTKKPSPGEPFPSLNPVVPPSNEYASAPGTPGSPSIPKIGNNPVFQDGTIFTGGAPAVQGSSSFTGGAPATQGVSSFTGGTPAVQGSTSLTGGAPATQGATRFTGGIPSAAQGETSFTEDRSGGGGSNFRTPASAGNLGASYEDSASPGLNPHLAQPEIGVGSNPLSIPDPNEVQVGPGVPPSQPVSTLPPVEVRGNQILVGGTNPQTIPIKDKFPGMRDGLPEGIEEGDIKDLLYKFHYTVGFHGHYEKGYKNGAKIGGYFVNGRDGFSRVVTYVADENGYRPKFKLVNLGLDSDETPKEATEKTFGLKSFEFVWYPIE